MNIIIVANALHTNTPTGGDKIFVECAKRWIASRHKVLIITNEAGYDYCLKNGVDKKYIILWHMSYYDRYGVYVSMVAKTIISSINSLFIDTGKVDVVFASSFFSPDIITAFVIKMRNVSCRIATAFYIFTYAKWGKDYSGGKIKGFFFFLSEYIALVIMRRYGSAILTASKFDKEHFAALKNFDKHKILAIRGGVDNAFFLSVPDQTLKYDGVFVGRFHPQKCVNALIDIWSKVVEIDNKRILALIGAGPLEKELKIMVKNKRLENNIIFLGIKDGIEKSVILKSSTVFISASCYDTGNIALDEALACGTPGVVYNLEKLDYPKGVIKVHVGDEKSMAAEIINILSDEKLRSRLSRDALSFAKTIDWNRKAQELVDFFGIR